MMRRLSAAPRKDWREVVQREGLLWFDGGGNDVNSRYWDESVYYVFSLSEIDKIEAATNELHQMCLQAAGHVIDNKLYNKLNVPPLAIPLIERSWQQEPPSLYGRFD